MNKHLQANHNVSLVLKVIKFRKGYDHKKQHQHLRMIYLKLEIQEYNGSTNAFAISRH